MQLRKEQKTKERTIMTNEKLAQTLTAIDPDQIKLDHTIKKILANKPILARIIGAVVEECMEMPYEKIEACIEGEVLVERVPVEPGLTNTICGNATEDAEPGEGCVYYDIRTYLKLPGPDDAHHLKILLNVEAQKDDTPGYDLTERALFYGCRMVSSQLDVEFTNRTNDPVKYGNIKKVYSIWICTETAEKRANRIVRYKTKEQIVFSQNGQCSDHQRYDIMQVIMVYISKNHTGHDSENDLICMLTDLFNEDIGGAEKIGILENRHGLKMSEPMKKEVANMCNYTTAIAEKNRQAGRAEGRAQGRAEEREELIARMLTSHTSEEIAFLTGYELKEVKAVEETLAEKA